MTDQAFNQLDVFVLQIRARVPKTTVTTERSGLRVDGPGGRLFLQPKRGAICITVELALQIAWWADVFDPPEPGASDMDWWAELSDAAEEWENLGFKLEQPGAFEEGDGETWYYMTRATALVSRNDDGLETIVAALRLEQTLLDS